MSGRYYDDLDRAMGSGSDDEHDEPPKGRKLRGGTTPRNRRQFRQDRSDWTPSAQWPTSIGYRPRGVAEQFIEQGTAYFGQHPRVNAINFARRLIEKVNADPDFKHNRLIHKVTSDEDRLDQVHEILVYMVDRFWTDLPVGAKPSGFLAVEFLDNQWDELWYEAVKNLRLRWILKGLEDGTLKRREPPTQEELDQRRAVVAAANARRAERLKDQPQPEPEVREERKRPTAEEWAEFQRWTSLTPEERLAERKQRRSTVAN